VSKLGIGRPAEIQLTQEIGSLFKNGRPAESCQTQEIGGTATLPNLRTLQGTHPSSDPDHPEEHDPPAWKLAGFSVSWPGVTTPVPAVFGHFSTRFTLPGENAK
jgi:hypothetical protein